MYVSLYLGVVLCDVRENKWVLGKPIGSGAFGDVYLACKGEVYSKDEADYVIKLEPHSNGPLFTEMHCLIRIGLPEHRYRVHSFFNVYYR